MSASLVGSEMCIRDRIKTGRSVQGGMECLPDKLTGKVQTDMEQFVQNACLLYTSDAADDM
eukprot:12877468-Alexandrium_andersonii.AAC.1